MYQIILPCGTVVTAASKAEAYRILAEARESYEGYFQ